MPNIRISLIGPNFFSYVQAICEEFISRGYPCQYFDERHSNSIATKIAYRLRLHSLLKHKRDQHLSTIRDQIILSKATDVFLINVEVVDPTFVKDLRSHGICVHLYMWDSSQNKNSFLKLLPLVNGRASFEPVDCARYNLTYIPLFAEKIFCNPNLNQSVRNDEVVFLGTLHSHRAVLLSKLEHTLAEKGFKIKKLLYYHSTFLYLIKCFFHPIAIQFFFHIRTKAFNKLEIANVYFKSRAVLDIHHPGQTGLTSRTFESLRSGAYLITLNKTALTLPIELRHRVILLANVSELADRIAETRHERPQLSRQADYFLSLERFAEELLAIGGLRPRQEVITNPIEMKHYT